VKQQEVLVWPLRRAWFAKFPPSQPDCAKTCSNPLRIIVA